MVWFAILLLRISHETESMHVDVELDRYGNYVRMGVWHGEKHVQIGSEVVVLDCFVGNLNVS